MPYKISDDVPVAAREPISTEALKQEVAESLKEQEAAADPRDNEEYSFNLDFKDVRGKVWSGTFRNRILDIARRGEAAVLQARMQSGLPAISIPAEMQEINYAVSWMEYSLIERPAWAKDLRKLNNTSLVLKIWEEVSGHEATFWRLGEDSSEG